MRLDAWRQKALDRLVTSRRLAQERMEVCAYIVQWMCEQAPVAEGKSIAEIVGALQVAGFDVDDRACLRALRYLDLTRVVEQGAQGRGYLLRSRPEDDSGRALDLA